MKCLSVNLWNINLPIEPRMEALNVFVSQEKPDIICFQEVSYFNGKLQIEDICHNNGYYLTYQKSDLWNGREEGLAIASQKKIVHKNVFFLPNDYSYNDMQRILLKCQIIIDEQSIIVYNTHLAYHLLSNKTRLLQNSFIADKMKSDIVSNSNVILCGDFNCFLGEKTICSILNEKGLEMINTNSSSELFSFDKRNQYCSEDLWPNRNIDFIVFSLKGHFKKRLCMTGMDNYAPCSDHFGVMIEGGFIHDGI